MSITYNGVEIKDISNRYDVYTHLGYPLNLWISLTLESCTETDTHLNVNYHMGVEAIPRWVGGHEGNGLSLRPYYKLSGQDAVYAEQWNGVIDGDNGEYMFYDNHAFSIPKDEYNDKDLNFGFKARGCFINYLYDQAIEKGLPAYKLDGWGDYYPFFNWVNNPEPAYWDAKEFEVDAWTDKVILPSQVPAIWYYDESTGVPHKGHAYYYDESGIPHKAKAIYFYDGDGKPIKCK